MMKQVTEKLWVAEFQRRLTSQADLLTEQFVKDARVPCSSTLFQRLLEVESQHRGGGADSHFERVHMEQSPQFAEQIRAVCNRYHRAREGTVDFEQYFSEGSRSSTLAEAARADNSESTAPLLESIGPYSLDHVLGRGGMGVVYQATHRKTGHIVALKRMLPRFQLSPQALQIFVREASIITSLKHPRIVTSYDFGLQDGCPYYVMELVPTIHLPDILATQSPKKRLRIVAKMICKVLEGLGHAHKQGIVHRDIKPANILVYRVGPKLNCKLADFGLAKRFADAGMSGLTEENEARGTLAFMAPEQLRDSRSVGPIADIYSTGVCFFEYLTNQLPYKASGKVAFVKCILGNDVRPLNEFIADCPADLQAILTRAMHRMPEGRYPSAEQMRAELEQFIARHT